MKNNLLKADFHLHTKEDKYENIRYTAKELIDRAKERGYSVISITNHNTITYSKELQDYASKRGIILIPGVEATIERRHVILINIDYSPDKVRTFDDVRQIKNCNGLVIAPHPYHPSPKSLNSKLDCNIDLFDAIEFSHFYSKVINFNIEAIKTAHFFDLPLIGTSDAHCFYQFEKTFTLIEAEKNIESIINAIRNKKIKIVSTPLKLIQLGLLWSRILFNGRIKFIKRHFLED